MNRTLKRISSNSAAYRVYYPLLYKTLFRSSATQYVFFSDSSCQLKIPYFQQGFANAEVTDTAPSTSKISQGLDFIFKLLYLKPYTSTMDVITKKLGSAGLKLGPLVVWVDSEATVSKLVDALDGLKKGPASIYIDLEGVNLSRHGTISIMQIYDAVDKCVYLVDIHTFGAKCFSTPGKDGRTLKHVLEDENIIKVFFDVRNDSDALYAHYNIELAGIHDLQLMEVATRNYNRRLLNGLAKCIDRDAPLTERERENMLDVKAKGRKLFLPEQGGSYEVFNQRPLPDSLKLYCVHDVQVLPRLYDHYDKKMSEAWRQKVLDVSVERVTMSHRADYVTSGRFMVFAPASWLYGNEV